MHDPELWENTKPYSEFLGVLLDKHKNKINWRADGRDSLMDIGCAGGGHTIQYILPMMPPNFDKLIGVDVSTDMIDYAQKTFPNPNIEFKIFDIVNGDTAELPQVDHITSLYVFHHLRDHEKALRNIYDLLKPGGDCFIAFLPLFAFYPAIEQIARDPKWSKHIKDVNDIIIPTHYSKNPESDFEQLLRKCNFSSMEINTMETIFEIGDINVLKDIIRTACAFYKGIPLEEYDAYTNDLAQLSINAFNSVPNNKHSNESRVYLPGTTIIAYAKK